MKILIYTILICLSLNSCSVLSSLTPNEKGKESSKTIDSERFQRKFYEAQKEKALDNPEKAFVLFQECQEIDPSVGVVYYEMARIESKRNNELNAVSLLQKAIKIEPENRWYLLEIAQNKESLGSYSEAVSYYSKAINLDPKVRETYRKKARNQEYDNDFQGAIKTYNDLEKWSGINEELSFKKMDHYLMLGKNSDAEAELTKLIAYNPDEIRYRGMLAEFYTGIGEKEKALVEYEKMRLLDPENGMLHWQLAQHYMVVGEFEKSHKELLLAFASDDVGLSDKNELMRLLIADPTYKENNEKLYELASILDKAGTNDSATQSILAQFYIEKGDMAAANEKLRNAIKNNDVTIDSWRRLLLTDYLLSDFEAMKEDSDAVLELYPLQPEFFLYSGFSKLKIDQINKGIISLKTGSQFVVEDEAILAVFNMVLSSAYKSEGSSAKEQESFEKSLIKAAAVTYSEVREADLDIKFGRTMTSMSRPFLAFCWYEIILENKPNDFDALNDMGDLHRDLGNSKGAVSYWERALKIEPSNEKIKNKLNKANE